MLDDSKVWNFLKYLDRVNQYIKDVSLSNLAELIRMLYQAHNKNRIFIFGNGGSMSTASHFANDLKSISPGFMTYCLNDVNTMSCIANDRGYDNIFYEQLISLASGNDLVIMLSASGNSSNLLKAVEAAKYKMALTVGIVGFDGGKLKDLVDVCLHVKSPIGCYREVEDSHSILCHFIVDCIDKVSKQDYKAPVGYNRGTVSLLDDAINKQAELKEGEFYYRIDYTGHGNSFVKDVWYIRKSDKLSKDRTINQLFKNDGGHYAICIMSNPESIGNAFAIAKKKIDEVSDRIESFVVKDYKITIDKEGNYWICYDSSHTQAETFDNSFVVDGLGIMVFVKENTCEGAFMRGKLLLDKFVVEE